MSYQKPELLVLSQATAAVRAFNDVGGGKTDAKGLTLGEHRDTGHFTSSSNAAYEADE